MAQIVIEIDDKTYKAFMELISINLGRSNYKGIIGKCLNAIKHGKVLPKGHGRLIDEKVLLRKLRSRNFGFNLPTWVKVAIDNTPTIIEADKEEGK